MSVTSVLLSIGVAIWISFMTLAIILPVRPNVLRMTRGLVCPKGSEMIIQTAVYSYHRPGQKALEISIKDKNGVVKNAGFKVVSVFWLILMAFSLPISIIFVLLISNAIK
jgi:uncharacterized membrane protein YccF (DUF307 family)